MSMMAKLMMMMTLIMAISGAATLFPTVSIMWAAFRVSSRALKWSFCGNDGNDDSIGNNANYGNDDNDGTDDNDDNNGNDNHFQG